MCCYECGDRGCTFRCASGELGCDGVDDYCAECPCNDSPESEDY